MNIKHALEIRLFRRLAAVHTDYTISLAEIRVLERQTSLTTIMKRNDGDDEENLVYFDMFRIPEEGNTGIADIIFITSNFDKKDLEEVIATDIKDRDAAAEYAKELQIRLTGYAEGVLDEQGRLDWTWKGIKV